MVKKFIVVSAAFCFAATGAFAIVSNATVSWDAPAAISGDTDVTTDGSLVAAFNMIGGAVTVNSVPFASFPATSLTTSTTDGNFTFTESPGHLIADNNLGSSQSPFSNLSSNYKTLLGSALDTDENNTLTLTISGLVVGQQYEFQMVGQ